MKKGFVSNSSQNSIFQNGEWYVPPILLQLLVSQVNPMEGNRDINCIWKNNKDGIRKYCIWKNKKGEIGTSIVFERRRRGTVRTRGCKSPAPWGGSPGCWGEFIMPQQWPHLSHWWGGFCVFFVDFVFWPSSVSVQFCKLCFPSQSSHQH